MTNKYDDALGSVNFCLSLLRNPRIPPEQNCIWSSGSHDRPVISEVTLDTIREALEKAKAYDEITKV